MTHPICDSCETVKHCSQHGCIPKQTLKPCRSPYCECTPGTCGHPGCYDARGEPWPPTTPVKDNSNRRLDPPGRDPLYTTTPAPAVQEPVAWFWFDDKEDEWKHLADNQADADKYLPLKVVPLYTTPPAAQRPWVGLTDEEREQHRDDWRSNIHDKEFRAIEAKLREKNI